MPPLTQTELIAAARAARDNALAPWSGVLVGAALEAADGTVWTGCNIESPTVIMTCCAERTALFKALTEGKRHFTRIAVISDFQHPIPPCGFCRQALLEYAPDCEVIMANLRGDVQMTTVAALLPAAYRIEDKC